LDSPCPLLPTELEFFNKGTGKGKSAANYTLSWVWFVSWLFTQQVLQTLSSEFNLLYETPNYTILTIKLHPWHLQFPWWLYLPNLMLK